MPSWKMRWRDVECSYTDAELEMIRGWVDQAEKGLVKPSVVANQWDVLQAAKLELGARLIEDTSLYDVLSEPFRLPAAFREDGIFKLPDDVVAMFQK